MKTEETDLFFKKMMASSSLEISKPGFNNVIMQKIMLEEKKKIMKRAIACSFLGLLTLSIIIFVLINNMKPGTGSPGLTLEPFLNNIVNWVVANQFIIIPIIVFSVLQRIINAKAKFS